MPDISEPRTDVLDASVIRGLQGLGQASGQDFLGQLVPLFLADADQRVDELQEALRRGDADAVVRTAHTLSGSAANLGAADLARLCATLSMSSAAADSQAADSKTLLDGIEAELGRVRLALGLLVAPA